MSVSKVSVVIPAYNAALTIGACLDAVARQDYAGEIETIVVDDGSTDTTAQIVSSFSRVILVRQANAGPAAARNAGFAQSGGVIVFFTDADCRPRTDWISRMVRAFEDPAAGAAAGSYGIVNDQSLLARCIHTEILYRHHHLMGEWIAVFGSYNVAFRRKVFLQAGGFNEAYRDASGEDNDLSYRLSEAAVRIRFVREALVDHVHPQRVGRYLFEQFRHGVWRARLYRDHPKQTRGDGYTFFKDVLEVPLSLVLPGFLLWGLCGRSRPALGLVLAMLMMECFFAWRFGLRGIKPLVFYGVVMMARAVARTSGLLWGVFKVGLQKS